ncbi:MAG TPA: Sir2 family NAD-dependent protein deacetylase [Acidimicrobiales bacterium]|nr:Sir2 family NAD-dependent protein deacetylase [Acidimicrobiales bacterium]
MALVDDAAPKTSEADLARARALIEQARRVVVLTGAGISTDSGIQDFRGPNGLWTKNPEAEKTMTLQTYMVDPEHRRRSWQNRLTSTLWDAEPNAGHRALVELERSGRLDTLVTQNIDGLHQKAGTEPALVVEIHGTTRDVICLSCGDRQPSEPVHERVRGGETDPTCLVELNGSGVCGGILKPATISFGQSLVPEDLSRAESAAANCDLLLAVGSTLGVFPAARLVPVAVQRGAVVVILNGGPTEMDSLADVVVYGRIGECLPKMVEGLPVLAG